MTSSKQSMLAKIELSLDGIRPHLKSDGGDIEVVELTDDNILKVRLLGACETCPMSFMTMKAGVEHTIRAVVPEIVAIESI